MHKDHQPTRGWVLYDGECGICIALASKWQPRLTRKGFTLTPLQEPWVMSLLGPRIEELCVIRADSSVVRGADAVLEIAKQFWWLRPFALIGRIPSVHRLLVKSYRSFAQRRRCLDGICRTSPSARRFAVEARTGQI